MAYAYDESIDMISGEIDSESQSESTDEDDYSSLLNEQTFRMSPRPQLLSQTPQPRDNINRGQTPSHNKMAEGCKIPQNRSNAVNTNPFRGQIDKPPMTTTYQSGAAAMTQLSFNDFLPQEIILTSTDDEEYDELNISPDDEYDLLTIAYNEGAYNSEDYKNLIVTPEIKGLFGYITQYEPTPMNLVDDVKLHPFIPDYYPSVGDIDAFIKVVEPDINEDGLGVKFLDEPAPFQSDTFVLDLRLRALANQSSAKAMPVKKVENPGENTEVIEKWIKDIGDLHRSKPSPSVHYSKPMPDIDLLLQEWSPEVEEMMQNVELPSPDLNCDLATYVDIVCGLLDVPVFKSRVQSLHVLFTLYATMKQFSNQFNHGGLKQEDFVEVSNSLRMFEEEGENVDGVDRLHVS